jgi:TPR repeat protein
VVSAHADGAEWLVARGESHLALGNIATARQFFLRAAETGSARGALLLAATYDPSELGRPQIVGVLPDRALAVRWYRRAQELGAALASERLARLNANTP